MLFKKISSLLNAILKNIFSGKDENKRNHMMAICTKTTLFSLQKNTDILWDYTYICKAIRSEDVERKNAGGSWFLIGEWEVKMSNDKDQ